MSWRAPKLAHLLDGRLQTARLELLEDPRITRAFHGRGPDPTQFLRQLIEEKLAAAARSGLGAIEASLRTDASEYLAASGRDPEPIRDMLDAQGRALLALEEQRPHELQQDGMRPGAVSSLFFTLWFVAIAMGWAVGDADTVLFAFLATGGALASALVYLFAHAVSLRRRAQVAREYPAVLCREYLHALEGAMADYESAVNQLAEGGGHERT